jgi:hypothetical protein
MKVWRPTTRLGISHEGVEVVEVAEEQAFGEAVERRRESFAAAGTADDTNDGQGLRHQ